MIRCAAFLPVLLCVASPSPSIAQAQTSSASQGASPAVQSQSAPAAQSGSSSPQTGSTQTGSQQSGQLRPRGPEASAQQDPNHVVATIAGKPVTAKQALDMLSSLRPEDRKRFESNLPALVQQVYMEDQLASEAARMKLDTQSPWKEQLRMTRDNILTQAYLSQASSTGATEDPAAYYQAHAADFDQVKLSGILVAFSSPGTPAGAGAIQRTEAAAQEKADDLEKKLKTGGDFSALARTDSDNQQSSVKGGDLGTFVMGDPNVPPAIRDRITKLQPGQISEPVRVPNGIYIFKLDSRNRLPLETVRQQIVQKQGNDRAQASLKTQMDKYKIEVQDTDFFAAPNSNGTSASKIPSLQRPAGPQPPTPKQ